MKKYLHIFFLAVFTSNFTVAQVPGSIDRTYGRNGYNLVNLAETPRDLFTCMASEILPNGDYFISGGHPNFANDANNEVIIKFKANGTGDSSFGIAGFKKFGALTANRFDLYAQFMSYRPASGKIIVCSRVTTTDIITLHGFKMNGSYDSSFGTNGVKQTTVKLFNNLYNAINYQFFHSQSDDKILIGGTVRVSSANERVFIYRLKQNGDIDSSFGTNGIKEYLTNAYTYFRIIAPARNDSTFISVLNNGALNILKLDRNGVSDIAFGNNGNGIAVIASTISNPAGNQMRIVQLNNNKIWIMHVLLNGGSTDLHRLHPNGVPDNSFNGNGTYRTNFFAFRIYTLHHVAKLGNEEIRAFVVNTQQPTHNLTIIRIKPDGFIDSTYGTNGLYSANILVNGYKGLYSNWVTRPDSTRILALGHLALGSTPEKAHALMLKPDGLIDSSYAVNGSAIYSVIAGRDYLTDVESMGNGKLLFMARDENQNSLYVGRLDSSGFRDPSFAGNGVKNIVPSPGNVYGTIIKRTALLNNISDTAQMVITHTNTAAFIVHKFKNNGEYDPAFGINGQLTVPITKPVFTIPKALYLPDGKILVLIGSLNSPQNENADILVIRLKNNGTRDSTFGTNGIVTIDQILSFCTGTCFGSRDFAKDMIYTSDGKILVTGSLTAGTASNDFSCMFRLNNNGTRDTGFGTIGKVTFFSSGWETKTVALNEQETQKYLVTLNHYNPTTGARNSVISRYSYNGTFDAGFSSTSMPNPTPGGRYGIVSMDVQADKKINILSISDPSYTGKPYITRINSTGTIDAGFGTNGMLIIDTLRVLPASDIEYNNFSYFRKDIQGRLVVGTVGEEFQITDAMFTRIITGDAPVAQPTPGNDECVNATNIIVDAPPLLLQSTEASTQSLPPIACTTTSATAYDVWYRFTATTPLTYIITTNSANFDGIIQAFAFCGGSSLQCANNPGNGNPDTLLLTGLTPGNTYSFRIYEDGSGAPQGSSFSVKVQSLVPTGVGDPVYENSLIILTPNPANLDQVNLIVDTRNPVMNMPITIHDIKGRLILTLQRSKNSGRASFELPIGTLAKGRYIVTVYNKQKKIGTASLLRL